MAHRATSSIRVMTHNYAATTASTSQAKTPTLQDIERVAKMLEAMPPEPIGEWMRQQGRPPEQWRVVLPESLRDEAGSLAAHLWPAYVAWSSATDRPIFVPCVRPLSWSPA